MFVITSDHRRWMLIPVSADCLWSYHLRQMSIPGVKTARYLRIRPVADVSNPALLQAIVSKSDLLAVWLLSGAANTEFPEASGRSGTSAVRTVALWLCSSDMCFFMIKSPFNYARNTRFVHMKCFRFFFRKRAREKLVVRWRCLLSIHFTHSQGQSFLVSSPAVWTHTLYLFLSLFLTVIQKWKYGNNCCFDC